MLNDEGSLNPKGLITGVVIVDIIAAWLSSTHDYITFKTY